jgi:hypothetical protein
MGIDTRRPPLPAPTETETDNDTTLRDDLATEISTRTDKTSYSIPEDGTPVTINTSKGAHKKYPSQTSLLIEYFEGPNNDGGKPRSRPSVRVRVTPSSRKSKSSNNDHLQITQTSRNSRKPSYTRRISLGSTPRDEVVPTADASYSEGSNVSSLPPVEIEVLHNGSDLSSDGGARYQPMPSDISSMPPDSMLDGTPVILPPGLTRRRSRSLDREEVAESMAQDTLKAPTRQRSRSMSKERITQRVMEKLQQKPVEAKSSNVKLTKSSREDLTPSRKSRHRISKSSRDDEVSGVSGTESSLLSSNNGYRRSGDAHSLVSGVSGTSSINNPKLLATVEDAIKRLILPEINALKEQQQTHNNRDKFERMSRDSQYETVDSTTNSASHLKRRVSKSSSAPHIHGSKPKVVLTRDGDDPGTTLSGASSRKERRSSRGSTSDRSYADSVTREDEKLRRKKSKDNSSSRDTTLVGLGAAGLTAAALKHHESRESRKEEDKDRRRRHSKSSRSRSASISESVEQEYYHERHEEVPPLPILQSELQGSELTRDSILSAETETRDRPGSGSSRDTGAETPMHEVPRGFAFSSPITPTRTPVALQRTLGTAHSNKSHGDLSLATPKSDRSYSSRSKEVSGAGLEAAAAAKARVLESHEPQQSQFEIAEQTPTRDMSPVQSEASYREEARTTGSPRHIRSPRSGASISSLGRKLDRPASSLSIQSFESSPSTKMARQRKRPQGVSLERSREALNSPQTTRDADDFFEESHRQNDIYRRQLEVSQPGSPATYLDYKHMSNLTEDSAEGQYLDGPNDNFNMAQNIRKVGSNPEYVHTPVAVESAVASLIEPSTISVRSSMASSPLKKSRLSYVSPAPDADYVPISIHEHPSQESQTRWSQIRDQAHTLAQKTGAQATGSPRQSLARSIDEEPRMHASAFPTHHDEMMPEIGFGVDDESDLDTNPSFIQGPLGGDDFNERADKLMMRQQDRERTPSQHSYSEAAAIGAGAAVAALAAAADSRGKDDHNPSVHRAQYDDVSENSYSEGYEQELQHASQPTYAKDRTPSRSPAVWKDEGYQSANQPGGITPDLRFRNESKLFDDDGLGEFDENSLGGDMFPAGGSKHDRHLSGNSHGMPSPLYDSSTGKGIDRIQSKDVVALMDHLTVRDAQRNARDTEILVTLVRSAAEMRNSFEEMKQFIRTQDTMIMGQNDKRADLTEQRILSGPRPQPLSSPRVPRSSASDVNELEQKKKNVFKRALKGLSLKGDGDIKKIEGMLMQLLNEVEDLKEINNMAMQQNNRSNSLTSYENLRASGDPGYEPEGRANTASSPNQSGYLSNPSSRRIQDMHSGFDVHQPHRVSTVAEDDEEYAEEEGRHENTERMTTPTQEAHRNNSTSQGTPPQPPKAHRDSHSQETTPKRKHKSNSSSIFGIPKMSRWSKTTASTIPESMPRNSGSGERRPYSSASRSGSQINVAYYDDDQYERHGDDRLRSNTSLAREEQRSLRSPSPLVPEDEPQPQYVLDDPKYQAHRNSLNLQHPQPIPANTDRHQNYLESQADMYDPHPLRSPELDQWGSTPSLARNRLSGGAGGYGAGHLSPISSDGGYSQRSATEQAAPPRPPKVIDDGPLIPQQPLAGHGQTRQMYSAQNDFGSNSPGALTPLPPIQEVRYSLETDTGRNVSFTLYMTQ